MSVVNVAAIKGAGDCGCLEKLESSLQLESIPLTPEERSQLLLALDDDVLGRTSLVTHRINMGDSPPIKQQPRRLPFALCQHVQQY
jgi:hypothetical protein